MENNSSHLENTAFEENDTDATVPQDNELSLTRIEEKYDIDFYGFFPDASF